MMTQQEVISKRAELDEQIRLIDVMRKAYTDQLKQLRKECPHVNQQCGFDPDGTTAECLDCGWQYGDFDE